MPREAGSLVGNRHHKPARPPQKLYLQGSFGSRARVEHRVAHKLRDEQEHVVPDRRRQLSVFLEECSPRGSGCSNFLREHEIQHAGS
jgi:hypothetical protein